MPAGTFVFHVARPPEAVFRFVGDLETAPQWVPELVGMRKITDGPVRVGTQYIETVQVGNKYEDAQLEVTEYDPPHRFAHKGEGGPSRFAGRFVLEPDGDGTKVTHHYTVKMKGCFVLFTPFVHGWVKKNTRAGITKLQAILAAG